MEQTRQIKGIWIPIEVWENTDLAWNEKILLMEIDSFTKQGVDCFISDEYIGKLLGVTERQARRYLSRLIELGFVIKTRYDGRKRYIESAICYDKNVRSDRTKMSGQIGQKCPDNNISIINKDNIKREILKREIPTTPRFVKPTIEEVQTYCNERKNGISGEEFWNFYESKGWMVGRNPMKDWRAGVRTWELSRAKSGKVRKTATTIDKQFNPYD